MTSTHTIGFVWPGPPVPGDAEEVARFVPEGVDWHIVGTPPDFAVDASSRHHARSSVRYRRELQHRDHRRHASCARSTSHRLRMHVRQLRARSRWRSRYMRPHRRRCRPPLDNDIDHGGRGARSAWRYACGRTHHRTSTSSTNDSGHSWKDTASTSYTFAA